MEKIKVRRYQIRMPEKAGRPLSPIRAVVLGDLHNREFGKNNRKLVARIMGLYPDLIFSVGDLSIIKPNREINTDIGISLLKRLSCECPVYCINGNHEFRSKIYPETYPGVYEKIRRNLNGVNLMLLEDTSILIEVKGCRMTLSGFELPAKYYKKLNRLVLPAEEIREHLGEPSEDSYQILLAHNPIYFESYALWGADLTLSGHLHGGLIRLPFLGGLVSPQIRLFPKYSCGLYQKYGRKLVVTAGLSTHSLAIRLNNPPEISLVEFY